jgi:hypothetical protein
MPAALQCVVLVSCPCAAHSLRYVCCMQAPAPLVSAGLTRLLAPTSRSAAGPVAHASRTLTVSTPHLAAVKVMIVMHFISRPCTYALGRQHGCIHDSGTCAPVAGTLFALGLSTGDGSKKTCPTSWVPKGTKCRNTSEEYGEGYGYGDNGYGYDADEPFAPTGPCDAEDVCECPLVAG